MAKDRSLGLAGGRRPRRRRRPARTAPRPRRAAPHTRYAADAPWSSTTRPASAAPGATPATEAGVQDRHALGEPGRGHDLPRSARQRRSAWARSRSRRRTGATPSDRTSPDERQRHHRQRPAPGRRPRTGGSWSRCQAIAPVTSPDEQAAQRPQREQQRRTAPCARARRRTRPWPPRRRRTATPSADAPTRQRAEHAATASGPLAPGRAARVRRRLGARAGRPAPSVPTSRRRRAAASPATGCDGGGQHGDQDRADDEDRLVDHRLERERGLQLARVGRAGATSGPGRTTRSAASPRRRRRAHRCGHGAGQSASTDGHQREHAATREDQRCRRAAPGLAEPVDQPALRGSRPARWRSGTPPRPRRPARRSRSRVETSSTMPRPTIEIGSRATSPVSEKTQRARAGRAPGGRT